MLQIQDITKKFGGLVALDSVSFTVNAGEIFGLIGPNGAGKTTLLNVIAGVYKPDGGMVAFRGERVSGQSSYKICNKGIARTFQISKPFPAMTVLENVKVAAVFGRGGPAEDPEGKARGVLEFVEFPMPEDTLAENLNALQLKRLDLARALASDPELLLLDEVAAGLRPTEYQELINLIVRVRDSGVTLIVVEHVMRLIMQICDRLGVLYYGRKIAEGPRDKVARDETVIEAYLGEDYLSE
jgi:branched-chain amino acid transport system ATP-binding protein